jgi:hypothetical protein
LNKFVVSVASAATLLLCGVASAQDATASAPAAAAANFPLHSGATLKSADGRRIGFIDQVVSAKGGQPTAVQVILDSRIVNIPASTITAVDKSHFTTSLSYKDVEHL